MVITGEEDYRTPIVESEQLYTALKLKKVDASLVRIPNTSHHGLDVIPSSIIAKVAGVLAWFEKYRINNDDKE
jgi:acylaminoacyl-peptidase